MPGDDPYIQAIVDARACVNEAGSPRHTWLVIGRYFDRSEHTVRVNYYRHQDDYEPSGRCPICAGDPPLETEHNTRKNARRKVGDDEDGAEWVEKSAWREEGNYGELFVTTSQRIRSLEDLCLAFGIDQDVWLNTFFEAGTYEGFAKREDKDLTFTNGTIDGHARSQGLIIAPMFRTKARFVRREPVPLHPAVQPIECPVTFPQPRPPDTSGVRRALIYADPQYGYKRDLRSGALDPFHDRRALSIVEQVAAHVQPDAIVCAGDILDNPTWTDKFIRSPEFYFTTQPAILEAHRHARRVREACPEAAIYWLEGNHDARIRDALAKHLLEACELRPADEMHLPPVMSPERLLALHKLGIEWVGGYPDGEVFLGPLRCQHGAKARKPPGATARAIAQDSDVDTVFGHVHRIEMVARQVRTRAGSRTVKTLCPGCVCRTDGAVPGSSRNANWQQGFAVVDYTGDDWAPTFVEIRAGRAVFDGRVWVGEDGIDALRADLPEWNW